MYSVCERVGGGRGAGWKLTQGAEVRGRFGITLFFLTKTKTKTRKQCLDKDTQNNKGN